MDRLVRDYTLNTDQYQIAMMYSYFKEGMHEKTAVFDLFNRRFPENLGYGIMAGLDKIIPYIENLHFSDDSISYLEEMGYDSDFIDYMRDFKFNGTIKAVVDGTPIFPNTPVITVEASILEAQIIETFMLSVINGATLASSNARKIVEAASGRGVLEFGSRRAVTPESSLDGAIYGVMAGCVGTSNVMAARMMKIKPSGTQAHSFIEAFEEELDAFKSFAKSQPNNCTLLVDTYDTLKSGLPNAIETFKWMEENNMSVDNIGIRIDSGDLAYLSKEARRMLVDAGYDQAKIVLSNGLKAETIESLILQGAEFDVLGVGDNIAKPEGNMGFVYKLVAVKENDKYIPRIKLSGDAFKVTNPGYKKVYRAYDNDNGYAIADVVTFHDKEITDECNIVSFSDNSNKKSISNFKLRDLQEVIFEKGKLVYEQPDLMTVREYCNREMETLYPEVKRSLNPHLYYVDGTSDYVDFKNEMIFKTKNKVKSK